jgi:hypothetical protein
MNLSQRLWRAVRSWLSLHPPPYTTARVEELPDDLAAGVIYVLGEGPHLWAVALLCPCGCAARIHLNLLPGVRPRWRVIENANGTVSIYPSVWRQTGCTSHFSVRYGRIEWYNPIDKRG